MNKELTPPSRGLHAARSRRAERADAPVEVKTTRWPILVLIVLGVALGFAAQSYHENNPDAQALPSVQGLLPIAAAPGALSSTWYCAGGTATGAASGSAEETIQIMNDSGDALTVNVTVMPNVGDSAVKEFAVSAQSRLDVVASSILKAAQVGVVVEVNGGEVAVSHMLEGPTGRSVAACSSSPSASWFVPSGTTRAGTSQMLALFNPFPSEAVVNVTFEADDGARAPQDFEAIVVPGKHVTVLDVSGKVTLRAEVATTVSVRSGRVIVDQIQTADGTQQTTKSLMVTPAAPKAMSSWWFADGLASTGVKTVFVVQNPSSEIANIELQIRIDDVATYGEVEPFEISVAPGRYAIIDVAGDGRVPPGVGYMASIESKNAVPIVADRVATHSPPATVVGTTVTMGSPVLATRWLVPAASLSSVAASTIVVANPSFTDSVTVTLSTVTDGKSTVLAGMRDVVVAAAGRVGIEIRTGASNPQVSIEVTSSSSVLVETRIAFEKAGVAAALAIPALDTIEVAPPGLITSSVLLMGATLDSSTIEIPSDATTDSPSPKASPSGTATTGT